MINIQINTRAKLIAGFKLQLLNILSIICFFSLCVHSSFVKSVDQNNIIESLNLSQIIKQSKKQQKVIVLYVSSPSCRYCKKLEKEILIPMLKSGNYKNKILLRNFILDSGKQIVNFNGILQKPKSLMEEYAVKTTPTLLFLDKNGVPLSEAIVGYSNDEFYWYYLDLAIQKSNQQLIELAADSNM